MSVLREEHEESQHPRGEHGRWTAKGGLGSQEHYCYRTRERSIGAPLSSNAEARVRA
jgi:hypothetical protein